MAIPDFQSIMLPLLLYLSDGQERCNKEIYDAMSEAFQLSEQDRRELLPSGKQQVFVNRVAWAKSYLKQASLLKSSKRGRYSITNRGKSVAAVHPDHINIDFLMRYPEFEQFRKGKNQPQDQKSDKIKDSCEATTPQEQIESGYQKHITELTSTVEEYIQTSSPRFFEKLILDILIAMGYGGSRQEAAKLTSSGADEGVDGVINEDRLGLDIIYVQAKQWKSNVGRPEIHRFAGALQGKRAKKGVFITSSNFAATAVDYVKTIDSKIILIDGRRLAELMVEYNVGVSVEQQFELKKINSDYFNEE